MASGRVSESGSAPSERATIHWAQTLSRAIPGLTAKMSATLQDGLNDSEELSEWMVRRQPRECPATAKANAAIVFFGLCMEHRESILVLLLIGARSSAFALVRSCFEAYMRGLWVMHLASDADLRLFFERGQCPTLERIAQRLSQALSTPVFGEIKRSNWETLCDFAHGGNLQVSRWITEDGIGPTHSDEEALEMLHFADSYALLALVGMNEAAGAGNDLREMFDKAVRLRAGWSSSKERSGGAAVQQSQSPP
jgi:hypothetical protein